jgi:alpha/beta superfamily hydrolase
LDHVEGEIRKLWIEGSAGRLEAALRVACPARAAAVVAHPHPLHGGTMHNPVIFHADRELHRAGFTTLRFNFRGVGSSEGTHDEGHGEVDDLAAATAWLRGVAVSAPMLVVGFSFGSICGIQHAIQNTNVRGVIAIGFPVRKYAFEKIGELEQPLSVVQGSEDEFGLPSEVQTVLDRAQSPRELRVVRGAPHLFPGRAREVAGQVVHAADTILDEL